MAYVSSFKALIVWQKSMIVVVRCYNITKQFPKHELFVLGDQMRRSAVSIPSNIAEGSKRHNTKEFYHFCGISQGSAAELETQLILVKSLHATIDTKEVLLLLSEI